MVLNVTIGLLTKLYLFALVGGLQRNLPGNLKAQIFVKCSH